ncbi:uncharacterized protein LOC123504553 [Portunus trituberculatus]|uniref:uncharacterized protein LOC123504553 n=1 Tax=Portunus trituberculatus TaxID=210409 RepID=UPI001E1CE9BC|nr:uncharacterized protein LOC123504553 [Portunus trituberculatus]
MPSDRTGFSSFELLNGKAVRGPLAVLRDLWEDKSLADDDRSCFLIELKDKLAESSRIAAEADISATRYKAYFDLKSQDRKFKPGEEVLVLLSDTTNKLLMAWAGPYAVLEKGSSCNYLIDENEADTNLNVSPLEEGATEPPDLLPVSPDGCGDVEEMDTPSSHQGSSSHLYLLIAPQLLW